MDQYPENAFFNVGTIEDVMRKQRLRWVRNKGADFMADTFGLEIYASNKLAFAGRAKTLTIPAVDGEQAFLAQHENIVAAIIPGEMRFEGKLMAQSIFWL